LIPRGVGNQNDLVGRFLMDHTDCVIWDFGPHLTRSVRSRFGNYWLDNEQGRHIYLHGLALSREVQQKEHLLNCHSYVDQFDTVDDDPWSALKRVTPALRWAKLPREVYHDARVILTHSREIFQGLYRRRLKHRPQLWRAKRNELHCILEQTPDPESRVALSEDKRDELGMPLSKIKWKISDLERQTARRMSQLIYQEFGRLRFPVPSPPSWLDEQNDWISRCVEKAHPAGTTRMSNSAKEGVVDKNCQVHGVTGLFVSGSSVFPTSGAANPTLMTVAMALRLADWLKLHYFRSCEVPASVVFPTLRCRYAKLSRKLRPSTAVKVGLVGTGRRICEVYLPVLQQLSSQYEIIGFTTGSPESARKFESKTGICSFQSARQLVEQQSPALLITAVPDRLNETAIKTLLDLRVPILTETPVAWSASGIRKIIQKAAANNVPVGVAEQTPFLPLEQFRKQLIDCGVFGDIYAAFNDFHSYSYHGIAQLRRYLKGTPTQVRSAEYSVGAKGKSQIGPQQRDIRWQSGSVVFNDGGTLLHHYALSGPSFQPAVHFHGTRGAMANDEIRIFNGKSGQIETSRATRLESVPGYLESISADLTGIGKIVWNNPFAEYRFSDEQIAVATILNGMSMTIREGAPPIYTAEDFLADIEIVQAFRYSAHRDGARVALPLQEKKQKAILSFNWGYWKGRLLK
jgi:predicted dehydrogenase